VATPRRCNDSDNDWLCVHLGTLTYQNSERLCDLCPTTSDSWPGFTMQWQLRMGPGLPTSRWVRVAYVGSATHWQAGPRSLLDGSAITRLPYQVSCYCPLITKQFPLPRHTSYMRKFAHIFEDEVRVWIDQDAATMKSTTTSAQNHDTWRASYSLCYPMRREGVVFHCNFCRSFSVPIVISNATKCEGAEAAVQGMPAFPSRFSTTVSP